MDKSQNDLIKIGSWTIAIIFLIRILLARKVVVVDFCSGNFISLAYGLTGYLGEAVGLGFIFLKLFDSWIWKIKIVQKLTGKTSLAKEYKGKIHSDYDDRVYKGTLTIKQTYSQIFVSFKSAESSSHSIVATIKKNDGINRLIFTYQNEPRANIQDRSPIHYGTAILDIDNVDVIEGDYYTGRNTRGHMIFSSVKKARKKG